MFPSPFLVLPPSQSILGMSDLLFFLLNPKKIKTSFFIAVLFTPRLSVSQWVARLPFNLFAIGYCNQPVMFLVRACTLVRIKDFRFPRGSFRIKMAPNACVHCLCLVGGDVARLLEVVVRLHILCVLGWFFYSNTILAGKHNMHDWFHVIIPYYHYNVLHIGTIWLFN